MCRRGANKDMWLGFASDYRAELGIDPSTPLERAYPLLFACSDAAIAITGQIIVTDVGYFASGLTESYPPATLIAKFLSGRPLPDQD
jgi:hypothetical protein